METTINYQNAIIAVLTDYKNYIGGARLQQTDDRIKVIADTQNHHYQLLVAGWKDGKYRFNVLFHFDIIDGKIWLQQNNTDILIADELIENGIPKDKIVLGFIAPSERLSTGFAA